MAQRRIDPIESIRSNDCLRSENCTKILDQEQHMFVGVSVSVCVGFWGCRKRLLSEMNRIANFTAICTKELRVRSQL